MGGRKSVETDWRWASDLRLWASSLYFLPTAVSAGSEAPKTRVGLRFPFLFLLLLKRHAGRGGGGEKAA